MQQPYFPSAGPNSPVATLGPGRATWPPMWHTHSTFPAAGRSGPGAAPAGAQAQQTPTPAAAPSAGAPAGPAAENPEPVMAASRVFTPVLALGPLPAAGNPNPNPGPAGAAAAALPPAGAEMGAQRALPPTVRPLQMTYLLSKTSLPCQFALTQLCVHHMCLSDASGWHGKNINAAPDDPSACKISPCIGPCF